MTMQVRLVLGWALVGIPLLYGLWETIAKAKNLFEAAPEGRAAPAGAARPSFCGPVPSRPCGFWSSAAVPASTRCAWRSGPTPR